ncbi:MAG TPA: MFS transporter [Gemmatimonadaceae bacterium]|jgi:MFS family permease|nr:MFS transporter [Gemmatimonadaceae bacterium]
MTLRLPRTVPPVARALRSRNYRLFFGGQTVSLIGTWITRVATAWLVYRLTGSALMLGVVGFSGQIPMLILAPFTGVLVDRWNQHRILMVTQAASMLQSAALAVLALSHVITVGDIIALQVLQGMINSFDTPTRQAFVVKMVDHRRDLSNAIAMNSMMVNGARIIGPSIGGVLIALVGEGWCFTLDAVSYLAVIGSLLAMHVHPASARAVRTRMLDELRDGLRYVVRFVPVRSLLLVIALVAATGMPYQVLLPAIARDVLHGGAHTYGILMTSAGVGAVGGALYLAARTSVTGLERVIAIAIAAFGAGLVAFSQSTVTWVSLAVLPVAGAGMMVAMASANTLLQTVVEERLRGRVMAFYTMAFLGTLPLGSLAAGIIASRIGASATVLLSGLACLAGGLAFGLWTPRFRALVDPIYRAHDAGAPAAPEAAGG